jgi:hypothetical protein
MAGPSRNETKRRYGREYMRRWRSRSKNRLRERLNRERWHWLRKVRAAGYGGPGPVKAGRRIGDLSRRRPARKRSTRQAGVSDISGKSKAGVGPLRYTFRNARGKLVCGFCRYRAPVQEVVRLRVDERVPGGYVKVRVPYCGEC